MNEPAGVVDLINFQGRVNRSELTSLGTCPSGESLLRFEKNKASSNSRYGLRVYAQTGESLLGRASPCEPASATNPYTPNVFKDFVAYRNKKVGAIFSGKVAKLHLKNFLLADNAVAGIEMPAAQGAGLFGEWGDNVIEDSIVVGSSRFNRSFDIDQDPTWGVGISTPAYSRLIIRNVTFIGFHCCFPAVGPMAKAEFQEHGGGYETRLEKIKFIESDFRLMWHWQHEGVMVREAERRGNMSFDRARTELACLLCAGGSGWLIPGLWSQSDDRAKQYLSSRQERLPAVHPGRLALRPGTGGWSRHLHRAQLCAHRRAHKHGPSTCVPARLQEYDVSHRALRQTVRLVATVRPRLSLWQVAELSRRATPV